VKKLIGLGIAVAVIIALVTTGTLAYFTDPEESTGNTFTAGTVDISADDENPWAKSYTVADIEPCYTGYITFTVKNVGTSDVVVWKKLVVTAQEGGEHPESELAEDSGDTLNNLASWTFYDLAIVGGTGVKDIILAANEVRVDNVNNCWIKLGTLTSNQHMDVSQSYHLRPETTNWAQGDKMTFTINLLAVQTNAPSPVATSGVATLDNKDALWSPISDGISGTVNYTYVPATKLLSGTFSATGLPDGNYDLIYYSDPWPGTGGLVLGTGTSASAVLPLTAFTGTPVPSGTDWNLPVGVKVWLVPTGAFVPGTPATWPSGWNPTQYLFETNLINLPQ